MLHIAHIYLKLFMADETAISHFSCLLQIIYANILSPLLSQLYHYYCLWYTLEATLAVLRICPSHVCIPVKIEPSEDPLPFMLLLGHEEYPTSTNYVAMTRMPHQGATQGDKSLRLLVEMTWLYV